MARCLGMEESIVKQISVDYKERSREQAYQMLLKWRDSQSKAASIAALCKALREEDLTRVAVRVFGVSDDVIHSL